MEVFTTRNYLRPNRVMLRSKYKKYKHFSDASQSTKSTKAHYLPKVKKYKFKVMQYKRSKVKGHTVRKVHWRHKGQKVHKVHRVHEVHYYIEVIYSIKYIYFIKLLHYIKYKHYIKYMDREGEAGVLPILNMDTLCIQDGFTIGIVYANIQCHCREAVQYNTVSS